MFEHAQICNTLDHVDNQIVEHAQKCNTLDHVDNQIVEHAHFRIIITDYQNIANLPYPPFSISEHAQTCNTPLIMLISEE